MVRSHLVLTRSEAARLTVVDVCRIIVGVKYCFRYNARNRNRVQDENGDPIDLATIPRTHRRRREKKLMTMDEVNERFPLTKYKNWTSTRAEKGLPTAGGVAGPASRAGSVRNVEGVVPPYEDIDHNNNEPRPTPTRRTTARSTQEKTADASAALDNAGESASELHAVKTSDSTTHESHESQEQRDIEEENDEDDQIQMAVPTEMLANPGDACAICLDTLEEDDDVRGLTCGHAFHASCLDPWLTSRRACCPLCKADYYIPKPRTEAEIAAEADRAAGRRPPGMSGARIDIPAPPQFAFIGGRGGTPFRPRMLLPGRFMTIQRQGPGHPTAERQARQSTRRERNQSIAAVNSGLMDLSEPGSTGSGPIHMFRNFRNPLPSMGRWRRRNDTAATHPSPEISMGNPTPGQLEAGS